MDKDLEFMKEVSNEQVAIFVETMLKKGGLTETLTVSDEYKKYGKKYSKYIERITEEFLDFGSNTLWFRKTYKEVLIDVADKLKINFNKDQSIEKIETKILEKVLVEAWEEMSEADKRELIELAKDKYGKSYLKAEGSLALITAFRAGGFTSYKITLIIVNAVAKAVLGRGLSFAANAGLTRAISIFAGPIGMTVAALWTAVDFGGPAYRVTVPCTIIIAAFRREIELRKHFYLDSNLGNGNTKEVTVSSKDELKKAIENNYDIILVEGELAKNLERINNIKKISSIDIIKILASLAIFCSSVTITRENVGGLANKFYTSNIDSSIKFSEEQNAREFSEGFILALVVILLMGVNTILALYKEYDNVEYEFRENGLPYVKFKKKMNRRMYYV